MPISATKTNGISVDKGISCCSPYVAAADRIERLKIAERRVAEQEAAEAASRQRYEASLQQQEKDREQRAQERRRRLAALLQAADEIIRRGFR